MTLSISTNNGTSSTTSTKAIYVQNVNWPDWSASTRSADSIVLRNMNAGFTTPNTLRIERSRIANVYAGSGIVANYQLPTKDGTKLFVQSNSVFSMTDSTDPTFLVYLPYVANFTLRIPNVPYNLVGLYDIASVARQLFAALTLTGGNSLSDGVSNLLNGVLDPNSWVTTSASSATSAE